MQTSIMSIVHIPMYRSDHKLLFFISIHVSEACEVGTSSVRINGRKGVKKISNRNEKIHGNGEQNDDKYVKGGRATSKWVRVMKWVRDLLIEWVGEWVNEWVIDGVSEWMNE